MESVIFASYLLSLSAISVNLIRAKLQDDFENELKDLREYDLSYEKIKIGVDRIDDGKFIVLANHKGVKPKAEEGKEPPVPVPLFAHTIPYANILDPVRYFQVSSAIALI